MFYTEESDEFFKGRRFLPMRKNEYGQVHQHKSDQFKKRGNLSIAFSSII